MISFPSPLLSLFSRETRSNAIGRSQKLSIPLILNLEREMYRDKRVDKRSFGRRLSIGVDRSQADAKTTSPWRFKRAAARKAERVKRSASRFRRQKLNFIQFSNAPIRFVPRCQRPVKLWRVNATERGRQETKKGKKRKIKERKNEN